MPEKNRLELTTVFLSDWKKRMAGRQKRNLLLLIAAVLVAFIICIVAFGGFQNRNYQRIVQQNMNYIMDGTIQEAGQIQSETDTAIHQVSYMARQYVYMMRFQPELTVEQRLSQIFDENLFDRIAFISEDGEDVSLEGSANVSDRHYFIDGMAGNTGLEFIPVSRVTQRPTMVFYAPVYDGSRIIGVMVGFYEQERIDRLFSYEFFHYAPEAYLLRKDGTVVATSDENLSKDNILNRLAKKRYIGDINYSDIVKVIDAEDQVRISFRFLEGKKTKVGVIVQSDSLQWMVLSILPYEVTEGMVSNANASGRILIIVVIATFLATMTMLLCFYLASNKKFANEMQVAEDSLENSLSHEQFQYSVIESLADIYSSVYFVDLAEGSYERVKEQVNASLDIPDYGSWKDGIDAYIKTYVAEEYAEEMKKFMTAETFIQRYEEQGILHLEYQRKDKGWRRAIMLPVKEEEDGAKEISSFVFAVQSIDIEKKKELDTKKALEEAYEAARMASDAKTSFLSNMSHDIRTPMNAIIGMTAIAGANLESPDKISDCLKKINVSSKHLLRLINEVLDMSKIESGKVDLNEEEFSLSDLIDALVNLNRPLIKEKNHSLTVTIKNLEHEDVLGDPTRLQQVLTNILSNAIKYTPDNGQIDIIVTEKETNKPTVGWFEVVIKDNGIGMSEEYMKNLFEPFVRSKDKRIQGIQGTGLGMPIAKNIIRMMNGDITVESELDKGTAFSISFVLRLQTEEEADYEKFVNLPVLVVDDDETACESTCLMLKSMEMDSEWVSSGKEAIVRVTKRHEEENDYYAVIVDWKMPEMDGVEVTRQIRKKVGDEVPIIIISAYDWVDIEQEARQAGANAFLSKPLFKSKVVSLFTELTNSGKGEAAEEPKASAVYKVDFTGKRILLAEDNEINSEIAVELLGMSGFELDTAFNGKECLEKFKESKPGTYDVILMDIQMPEMNGYEAAKAIRALDRPDAKKIPIIAMTANAFSSDVRAAHNAGMNDHISKPIDINHLIKVLDEHIFQGGG